MYAASCREFGVDPAGGIEDPWLAAQLRFGLFYRLKRDEYEEMEKQRAEMEESNRRDDHLRRMDRAKQVLSGGARA